MNQEFKNKYILEICNTGKESAKIWKEITKNELRIDDLNDILKDSKFGIRYFLGQTFFKGRGDWLSNIYRRCFVYAFDAVFKEIDTITKDILKVTLDELLRKAKENVKKY